MRCLISKGVAAGFLLAQRVERHALLLPAPTALVARARAAVAPCGTSAPLVFTAAGIHRTPGLLGGSKVGLQIDFAIGWLSLR